ncbi:MAG: transporter substrate-binding domain-containing protein [Gammaproteobacteria bacterium]|nr:transporter substrate-binding domain-containing protein [Gammaproteobacteria bacterium]
MKFSANILAIIVAALLASWLTTMFTSNSDSSVSVESPKETAYERIVKTDTIRCAYAVWPPYMMVDANSGQLSGAAYDQMVEIAKYLELKLDWVEEVGYGNYIEGLNTGRYDMLCATVWPDGPRTRNTTLTIPGFFSTMYAFSRAGDVQTYQRFSDIDQASVTIAAVDGDATYSLARSRFPNAKVHALTQISEGNEVLLAVMSDKADIALVDEGVFLGFDRSNSGKLIKLAELGPIGVFSESYSVPLGDFQLKNMIDTALIYLTNSGITEEILNRYEGSLYPPAPTFEENWR